MKLKDGYKKLIGTSYNGDISLVLLSNGGNLGYAISSTASTLVLRNTNGLIESSLTDKAPFKVSSKVVTTNFNADLLDGVHKEGLLTALTNVDTTDNPKSISITVGDTTKYLKVTNATYSSFLLGGALGNIIYQSAADTTAFLANPSTNGYVLKYDTTNNKPYWAVDSDTKVTQTITTTDADYRVLFSGTADNTTKTETARKAANLKFNPSSGLLTAGGFVKSGSDDTYVLLGGGGHKSIASFQTTYDDRYVTLGTTLTITGHKTFSGTEASLLTIDRNSTNPAWIKFAKNGTLLGYIGINNDKIPVVNLDEILYQLLHSGNSYIRNGVITINGTSITPLTAHQSLANYVTLDTAQTISGVKTFSTQLKFTVAQGTAPFTVTSTTQVTNLNADLLDGTHKSELLTALANVNTTDNPLSIYITVGGTTKYLKVSYSQHSTDLVNTSVTNPDSAVSGQYLKWYSQINRSGSDPYYAGTNTGFPVSSNANGILWLGTHSGPYGGLVGVSSNGRLYYRFITNNTFPTTADGGSWNRVAWSSEVNALKNYYWANIKISSTSSITTNPIFATATATTSVTTPLVSSTGGLTLNATNTTLGLKFNNDNTKSVVLNGAEFKPFDNANGNIDLGASDARWKGLYSGTGNFIGDVTLYNSSGGSSPRLIFLRSELNQTTQIDWSIYDTVGDLVFLKSAGNGWEDVFRIDYDTNATTVVGNSNAAAFVLTGTGISDFSAGTIKFDTINIPTTSGGTTFGTGSNGQVLKSNGTTVYWGDAGSTGNSHYYSWTAATTVSAWSRIMNMGANSNVILTINFSLNTLSSSHTYFISTGWLSANIALVMHNGYTHNSTPQIRVTCSSANSFHVEVYNTYGYNGATSINFACTAVLLCGTLSTISTYTEGGGTNLNGLTSSHGVARNFNADLLDSYHALDFTRAITINSTTATLATVSASNPSFLGSVYNSSGDTWYNILSIRHRNNQEDGNLYGLYILSFLTGTGNLIWNKQYNGTWQGERTILDSGNYTSLLDGRYVNVTGDTMTGNLTVPQVNGNLNGNIVASAPQLAAAGESNNINIVNNAGSSITTNSPGYLAAITKAIRFRWYDTYWEIGNIRGSSTDSAGFGITVGNSNLRFRITDGAIYAYGNMYAPHFYESSDVNLKTNIEIINTSDNIPLLKAFDWKEDGSHSYGLIAQELEEQGYSELVSVKDDGYKTVNYSAALSLIVGKLQVKIKELEKEIENLKNKN